MVGSTCCSLLLAVRSRNCLDSHERITTLPKTKTPKQIVTEIEIRRIRAGINKQTLAKKAGIIPEMYSYLLRRGRQGKDLPADCEGKVQRALQEFKEAH